MHKLNTDFVTVLCTGQLWKFDMADNALREAGIAHQVRAESASGVKTAVPITRACARELLRLACAGRC